jgi:ERCC4-type nuclease
MNITIDVREQDLIKMIKQLIITIPSFKDIEINVASLPIGDIVISDKEEEKLIIERKSIQDLSASIKDKRYEEQSYRLNGSNYHNHNIIYLIEGDVNKSVNVFKSNSIDKLTLYSAIFSLNYYKGFSVLRTFSIEETAIFICNTLRKMKKGLLENKVAFYKNKETVLKEKATYENNNEKDINDNHKDIENQENSDNEEKSNGKNYVNVIKKIKKENITPDNIGEIMLCQIPGISSVTALAIMKNFKTFHNLISSVETDKSCLNNITYKNAKLQERKISKTCITNIIKYLIKNE